MANLQETYEVFDERPSRRFLRQFTIAGLLGGDSFQLDFPDPLAPLAAPAIVILSGRNGVGKTTILRMIGGMIELNFDLFRKFPFLTASLTLSTGQILRVQRTPDLHRPLSVSFGRFSAVLSENKETPAYSQDEQLAVSALRNAAMPVLRGIRYELVELNRIADQNPLIQQVENINRLSARQEIEHQTLAKKVSDFLRDAQVNHERFFRSEGVEFLPRLLDRLSQESIAPSLGELSERISAVKTRILKGKRFGLISKRRNLLALEEAVVSGSYDSEQQRRLLETYVEAQEADQKAKDLLISRLETFENTMNEFLIGKEIRIYSQRGIVIKSGETRLSEFELSSGERHFLSMMVVALLCQRTGTIIAIDEPELSLHISWQRKIVGALAKCAAGASPLFIFATHSLAISAEHADSLHRMSSVD